MLFDWWAEMFGFQKKISKKESRKLQKLNADIDKQREGSFFGHIDSIYPEEICGWVSDVRSPQKGITVKVSLKGKEIGRSVSSTHRTDLKNFLGENNRAGFRISLEEVLDDKLIRTQKLEIVADFGNGEVFAFPYRMKVDSKMSNINQVKGRVDVVEGEFNNIRGSLDVVDGNGYLAGWCAKPNSSETLNVAIYVDNKLKKIVNANKIRQDLIGHSLYKVNSGFECYLDNIENVGEVSVRVNGLDLTNSPKTVAQEGILKITIDQLAIKDGMLEFFVESNVQQEVTCIIRIDEHRESNHGLTIKKEKKAFSLPIDDDFLDTQYHVFQIIIKTKSVEFCSDVVLLRSHNIELNVDSFSKGQLHGWIGDSSNRQSNLSFSGIKDIRRYHREDVFKQKGFANAGFTLTLPYVETEHIVNIQDTDKKTDLARFLFVNTLALNRQSISENKGRALKEFKASQFTQSKFDTLMSSEILPYKMKQTSLSRITVIVPVYSGVSETVECIESVLSAKNSFPFRMIIINDKSPDAAIYKYLEGVRSRLPKDSVLVTKSTNKGFSYGVNIGITLANGEDIILLNADTVVSDGWIDKLREAAYSSHDIGTVTPFSNNAEICTLPYSCKSLYVDSQETASTIDKTAEMMATESVVDIPVAIGFCMYIKNDCVNDVGLFDYATWGRGYGEEVDFCMKASAYGWRHVLSTRTFVVHRGSVSFKDEKIQRIKESSKKISEKYPFYDSMIANFLENDPVNKIRRCVNIKLIASFLNKGRVLHISHSYGGGTQTYVDDYISRQIDDGYSPVLLEFNSDGSSVMKFNLLEVPRLSVFMEKHEERFSNDESSLLREVIEILQIGSVHFHSPFGLTVDFIDWIRENYDYRLTLHDYAWFCKDVNLSPDEEGKLCGVDGHMCGACMGIADIHPGLKLLSQNFSSVLDYRDYFRRLFVNATELIAGGSFVKEFFSTHGYSGNYKVVPHDQSKSRRLFFPLFREGDELRVALVGAISHIKGSNYLERIARYCLVRNYKIRFIVFGYTDNPRLDGLGNVVVTGKYNSQDHLFELMQMYQPHVCFFPNIWPETYSYTLSHALDAGLPVLVSNLGVPAERVISIEQAGLFDLKEDLGSVVTKLLHLALRNV